MEEAVRTAREGNLGLVSPRLEAEGKRRADALAWNNFLPTVDASGTLGRWNVEQSVMGVPLPRWSLSASFSAQLMLNLALFEGVKSLRADYEAGLISYAQAEARLERDVRKSFYNLLLLEENMKLMEEQIEAARRRYEQARANYRAGTAPELSMLQAQVAFENLKPALEEMRIARPLSLGLPLPRDRRLKALCDALMDNPADGRGLTEWAEQVGASARTLARLFQSELGTSFGAWRQQLRLAKAVDEISRGLPMAQVAAAVGYASQAAFSAMFAKALGVPPSRFTGPPG